MCNMIEWSKILREMLRVSGIRQESQGKISEKVKGFGENGVQLYFTKKYWNVFVI